MLFNAEYCEEAVVGVSGLGSNSSIDNCSNINENLKAIGGVNRVNDLASHWTMFTVASPSPTRTMIKEANDHLQLLHQKVTELEKTVREQAEALIKKDELMQTRLKELADMKDDRIMELSRSLDLYEQRVEKLEQSCKEKDSVIEMMNHRCGFVDELVSYTPLLEGLVSSLKAFPASRRTSDAMDHQGATPNRQPSRRNSNRTSRQMDRHNHPRANNLMVHQVNAVDHSGEKSGQLQSQFANADMKIGRSFNINRNFSMSEDEDVV